MNDLISIIVPIYNVEKYINKCIESIINQTYKNLEIILVDDGSPDDCPTICDEYKEKDDRIIVIHKKNGGLSDARNVGIENASGKYICFVDSDDYIEYNYVEVLYSNIIKYNVKISCAAYRQVFEVDNHIKDIPIKENIKINYINSLKELVNESVGNFAWNKIYDINLFNDLRFPLGRKMEDLGIMYKLFEKAEYIYVDSRVIYNYVQRENSILHNIDSKFIRDRIDLIKERFEYLKNKNIKVDEIEIDTIIIMMNSIDYLNLDDEYFKIAYSTINNTVTLKYINKLPLKQKIKYCLLKINPKLYLKIFDKGGKK